MSWDAIGAIAELIGAIAVVASLGYLALQIRRSSRDSELTVYFSLRSNVQQFRAILAENSELARIYREGLADLDKLGDDDRWRFGALMQYEFAFFEDHFRLGREIPLFRSETDDLRWFASRPGARAWWAKGRRLYHPEFQQHVDSLIASPAGTGSSSSPPPAA